MDTYTFAGALVAAILGFTATAFLIPRPRPRATTPIRVMLATKEHDRLAQRVAELLAADLLPTGRHRAGATPDRVRVVFAERRSARAATAASPR